MRALCWRGFAQDGWALFRTAAASRCAGVHFGSHVGHNRSRREKTRDMEEGGKKEKRTGKGERVLRRRQAGERQQVVEVRPRLFLQLCLRSRLAPRCALLGTARCPCLWRLSLFPALCLCFFSSACHLCVIPLLPAVRRAVVPSLASRPFLGVVAQPCRKIASF